MDIHTLADKKTAVMIGEFLTGSDAFDQAWTPDEKGFVKQAPLDSLANHNHSYWYVENSGTIIAALGIRENKFGSGGFEMVSDYMAVHKDYRRQGIAQRLLEKAEEYVKDHNGRYIHILTCDIPSFIPASMFYQKNGYKKVARMPNYYLEGEGRIDFYKELK